MPTHLRLPAVHAENSQLRSRTSSPPWSGPSLWCLLRPSSSWVPVSKCNLYAGSVACRLVNSGSLEFYGIMFPSDFAILFILSLISWADVLSLGTTFQDPILRDTELEFLFWQSICYKYSLPKSFYFCRGGCMCHLLQTSCFCHGTHNCFQPGKYQSWVFFFPYLTGHCVTFSISLCLFLGFTWPGCTECTAIFIHMTECEYSSRI